MADKLQRVAMAEVEFEAFVDPELYQRLHEAVVEGDEAKVRGLLQKFSRDEARNILQDRCSSENEVPLLIVAIRHRHVHLVQLFVDHYDVTVDRTGTSEPPEDSDIATEPECSPLLESILVSCPKILDIISKKVRDIDSEYPVHLACQRQTPEAREILVILLQNGADVNLRDKMGLTPLITACQYGNTGMAHKLLRHGANENLCSSDGNTALHCLIERFDDVTKSKQKKFRRLSKVLLRYDMEQKPNAQGLTPVRLACLKGNIYIVEIILENMSVNDRERANCFELLASSVFPMKKTYNRFLRRAMELRHSHDPPLWKCTKPDGLEAILSRVEAQTPRELQAAIKKNLVELIDELLLARQRIIDESLYNDFLMPFIGQYIRHKTDERCVNSNVPISAQLTLLLYAFKVQLRSPVPPSSAILIDRIEWIDSVCRHVERCGTVDMAVFSGILDSIEEFYKCKNTENAWLARDTYVLLLNFLYRVIMNALIMNNKCIDSQAMTKRFIRLTKGSLESNLNSSTGRANNRRNISSRPRHSLHKLVASDNMLHIACGGVRPKFEDATHDVLSKASHGLAEFFKLLHACGEDVNAQNSDGQSPLNILLCHVSASDPVFRSIALSYRLGRNHKSIDFAGVVHSLLLVGANPNLRDKSEATCLHTAMNGYAQDFPYVLPMDVDMKGWYSIVELLMKSGANPNAIDYRGFTPLHELMDKVFPAGVGYDEEVVTRGGDRFEDHRQLMHKIVKTVLRYGGCANAFTNDGRTVFDMCKDEDLKEELTRNIRVTRVYLTLSHLAAAAIRKHQVQYHEKLPTRLIKIIELGDWPLFEELTLVLWWRFPWPLDRTTTLCRHSWVGQSSRMSLFCIDACFAYISCFLFFYTEITKYKCKSKRLYSVI